jgi:hypothetical protein
MGVRLPANHSKGLKTLACRRFMGDTERLAEPAERVANEQ